MQRDEAPSKIPDPPLTSIMPQTTAADHARHEFGIGKTLAVFLFVSVSVLVTSYICLNLGFTLVVSDIDWC